MGRRRGLGGGGLRGSCWPSIVTIPTFGETLLAHFAESSRRAGSMVTVTKHNARIIPYDPGLSKTEIENVLL